ncbi:hypothetical protein RhoFasB10_03318 [Rhodococcus sp. B10]|nr:hypothetical protein [Rhodococcus sp. B10]
MGFRNVRVSDVSGIELNDKDVVNVVVRSHPQVSEARQFDASAEELKALKTVNNLVLLEYRLADGSTQDVYVSATEFAKLIPNDKLESFDPLRGRRKNFRPGGQD